MAERALLEEEGFACRDQFGGEVCAGFAGLGAGAWAKPLISASVEARAKQREKVMLEMLLNL